MSLASAQLELPASAEDARAEALAWVRVKHAPVEGVVRGAACAVQQDGQWVSAVVSGSCRVCGCVAVWLATEAATVAAAEAAGACPEFVRLERWRPLPPGQRA